MYRGLVVGGPRDGEILEHDSNLFRIENPPGSYEVVYRMDGTPAAMQPNRYFQYLFDTRYWVPYRYGQAIQPITAVLERLEANYMSTRGNETNADQT